MNLTQALKDLIVDRFKSGETIARIAVWYQQAPEKIEGVLRKAMQNQDLLLSRDFQMGGELFAAKMAELVKLAPKPANSANQASQDAPGTTIGREPLP